MMKVEPYEHRGSRYSSIEIKSKDQVENTLKLFQEEDDIWLKKILGLKLFEQNICNLTDRDTESVRKVIQCRLKS